MSNLHNERLDFWAQLDDATAATRRAWEQFAIAYPPDKWISWTIGGGGRVYRGHVIRHAHGAGRLEVRNDATGRARFIHAGDVVRPLFPPPPEA